MFWSRKRIAQYRRPLSAAVPCLASAASLDAFRRALGGLRYERGGFAVASWAYRLGPSRHGTVASTSRLGRWRALGGRLALLGPEGR
jgi:hypothetical protein